MLRAILVLIFAILQIATAGFTQVTGMGISVQERAEAVRTVLTPAGYAFAIWGVIYLTNFALALYQVLPGQWHQTHWRSAGWWLILAYASNSLWQIIVPLNGITLVSAALIFVLVFASLNATRALQSELVTYGSWQRALIISPVALLAGWAAAASVAGFPSALVNDGIVTSAAFREPYVAAGVLLAAFLVLARALVAAQGALAIGAAGAWALIAIIVQNRSNPDWPVYLSALIALFIFGLALLVTILKNGALGRART
ncbi:MAG TPA: hypothetical protein DCL54_07940 [Alphaproteobacteria bacterium]|nr:hypothetical protein [Alphaproteobacteria bacterium]HAJ46495.1 hypothetical protein [Alphaproteobacteria bacterium]